MKSGIILFFVWGVCFNTVASYHPYPGHGYQQGTYQQNSEWPNNQNYPQNPGLAFPARQPPANYGASQSVVNYVQGSPQANYEQEGTYPETPEESVYVQHPREAIFQQQFPKQVEQSQSDVNVEPASPPQTFAEVPRPYTASHSRTHESYGAALQPSQWQPPPPPPNPVFVDDSYPPQVPRHWIPQNLNSYPPINHQEPNFRPPQWQSAGPQKKPNYGSTYDGQNNAPLQYIAQAETQASAASANTFQEKHEHQNKPFQVNLPKVHNIVIVEDGSGDNSESFQSGGTEFQEKNLNIRQENLYKKNDPSPPDMIINEPNNIKNINTNLREFNQNTEVLPPLVKETYPGAVPFNEKYIDNNSYQKNENYPKESHVASTVVHDYRLIPVFKPTYPHENKVVEPNIVPPQSPPVWNNNYNNHIRQPAHPQAAPSPTDELFAVKDSNDKKYENIEAVTKKQNEPLNPIKEETVHKYHEALGSHLAQPHTKINLNPPTINAAELNNNRNTTFNSLPTNEEKIYLHNLSQIPNNIRIVPAEYRVKPSYVKTTDAPNPLDDPTTTLPYQYQNQAKTSDEFNTSSKLAPPKTLNNENLANNDQTKVYMQELNNDTSSNAQNNQEDANPSINEFDINATNILTSVIDKNPYSENITATNNIVEIKLNSTNTKNYETYSDSDDDTLVDSKTGSSAAVDDIAILYLDEKEDTLKEDFSIYIDIINNDDNEEAELPENLENINLDKEVTPDIKSGKKEVADFPKHLSKAMFWIRPDEGFLDDYYSENETEPNDDMYMCNVKFSDLIIERTSKFYMHKNGTFVVETEEIIWEHKDDAVPREIKTTKTMRNPEPKNHPKKKKTDALEAPKCFKQPNA